MSPSPIMDLHPILAMGDCKSEASCDFLKLAKKCKQSFDVWGCFVQSLDFVIGSLLFLAVFFIIIATQRFIM